MTTLRFERMTSPMWERRLFGACSLKAFSVEGTVASLSVNAIVTTLPFGEVALMPPFAAKPAMKPTWTGAVVASVNCFAFRQPSVPFAVNGVLERAPQPAASSANTAMTGTNRTATTIDSTCDGTVGARAAGPARRARLRQRGAARQSARRPARAPALGLRAARDPR